MGTGSASTRRTSTAFVTALPISSQARSPEEPRRLRRWDGHYPNPRSRWPVSTSDLSLRPACRLIKCERVDNRHDRAAQAELYAAAFGSGVELDPAGIPAHLLRPYSMEGGEWRRPSPIHFGDDV